MAGIAINDLPRNRTLSKDEADSVKGGVIINNNHRGGIWSNVVAGNDHRGGMWSGVIVNNNHRGGIWS